MENKTHLRKKRLAVDISIEFHQEIKKRAILKNETIKQWIEKAIVEYIKIEQSLGYE